MLQSLLHPSLLSHVRWSNLRSLFRNSDSDARADLRHKLILKTTGELLRSDDCESILRNVVQHLVPEFGDWCLIDLLQPDGSLLRYSEARSMSREKSLAIDEIRRRYPPNPSAEVGLGYAIRTGQPQMLHGIQQNSMRKTSKDPEYRRLWEIVDVVSFIAVPIMVRGRIYGGFGVDSLTPGRYFTQRDFIFIQELAGLLGLALERAELIRDISKSNQQKDEFLAMLSHELRSPLSAILGWTKVLRLKINDPVFNAQRALETIERNAEVQRSLVEDILDISLVTLGRMRIKEDNVDLNALLEKLVESNFPQAQSQRLTLRFEEYEAPLIVRGDPRRLHQAFANLMNNAIKFSEDGGTVEISVRRSEETFKISIRDHGIGIEPEFLPHVFERFRQGDGAQKRLRSGMGLGLALVRHIIELHGGRVEAFSEGVDRGSTFTVTLPCTPIS